MDIEVYESPERNGIVRIVYDGGDGGIIEVDPRTYESFEVDGVDSDWIRLSPAPDANRVTEVLARASDAKAGWHARLGSGQAVSPAEAGRALLEALRDAVALLGEISGKECS
jgi:hypothetical protein